MVGHKAICQQAVTFSIHAMDFVCYNLCNARSTQPVFAVLSAVKPFIVFPEIFLLNQVTLFRAGALQFFFALLLELQPERGRDGIGEVEGDEESMTFGVNVWQAAAIVNFVHRFLVQHQYWYYIMEGVVRH